MHGGSGRQPMREMTMKGLAMAPVEDMHVEAVGDTVEKPF